MDDTSKGWRFWLAAGALALAIFSVLWFAAAALGSKWGWWGWQFGLGKMTISWGPMLLIASLATGVLALIAGLTNTPRNKPVMLSLGALLIAGLAFGRIVAFGAQASQLPPIHDVQTDWSDPVTFSDTLMAAREAYGALNPVLDAPVISEDAEARWPGLGGRLVSEVQEEAEFDPAVSKDEEDAAYPDIEPQVFDADRELVAAAAARVIDTAGWDMVKADVDAGVLEATETSGWFGFKDDIAVRIRPEGDGARVDIRSTSRVGLSDLGANSARIDEFQKDLAREVAAAKAS